MQTNTHEKKRVSTKTSTLRRATFQNVRIADLPSGWKKVVGATIDDELIVEVIPKSVANKELSNLMDDASDEWEANGGTREILKAIVDEK